MKNIKNIISLVLAIATLMSCMVVGASAANFEDIKDLNTGADYYEAVKWAFAEGYMTGTSATTFAPDKTLTRAEFATLIARFSGADLTQYANKAVFSDVSASSWCGPTVAWASENKIMNGTGNGKFSPNTVITRQEIAVLFNNFVNFKGIVLEKQVPETRLMDRGSKKCASWAKDAVISAYKTNILPLDENDCFNPTVQMTRGDAAMALYALDQSIDRLSAEREPLVVAYYDLNNASALDELKDVDVINLHPFKANGENKKIDTQRLSRIESIRNTINAMNYNPDLKYVLMIPVDSGPNIEKWLDSYADCDEFAEEAVKIIAEYDLDGLDFDYEFPSGNVPQKNLQYFLTVVRNKLEALGTGKDYIISMAIAGGTWSDSLFQDLGELQHYVDYLNYMDYDLHSEKDITYDHAAVYDSIYPNGSTYADAVMSINAGMQREKIVLGVGAYTQNWSNVQAPEGSKVGLHCVGTHNDERPIYFNAYRSWIDYEKIDAGIEYSVGGWYPHYNETSGSLSFYNPSTKQFASGDDDRSIENKCKIVVDLNLGGIMYFDYTQAAGAYEYAEPGREDDAARVMIFEKTAKWLGKETTDLVE
ncbi:MAG: S-layer homology domain-containing protein [Clostridia bacterium]|nr:S-layer homology domain-containing protein [Clostridia bacterium]